MKVLWCRDFPIVIVRFLQLETLLYQQVQISNKLFNFKDLWRLTFLSDDVFVVRGFVGLLSYGLLNVAVSFWSSLWSKVDVIKYLYAYLIFQNLSHLNYTLSNSVLNWNWRRHTRFHQLFWSCEIRKNGPTLINNSFCGSFVVFSKLLDGINIDILYHLHVLSTLFLATYPYGGFVILQA